MEFIDSDALATPPAAELDPAADPPPAAAAAAAAVAESSLTATKSSPHRLKRLRVASQGSLTSGGVEAFIRGCGKNLIQSRISTCARPTQSQSQSQSRVHDTRDGRMGGGWEGEGSQTNAMT